MIIIEICSGLGNQMFRYAFARALALENNQEVYFSTRIFKRENREYGLDKLCIEEPKGIVNPLVMDLYTGFWTVVRKLKKLSLYNENDVKTMFEQTGFYKTALRKYIPLSLSCHKVNYYNANFQAYEYFSKYEDVIRKELQIKAAASAENMQFIEKIKTTNAVCLHIRRGDYLWDQNSKVFDVCTKKYYVDAINYAMSRLDNPIFYVFSEDMEWVKEQNLPGNLVYVELNNPDYEELRLMYSCKHFIISNSTFSWWAQFLSENKNKLVIAPNKWTNDENENENSLYQDNWHLIEV